MEQFLLVIVDKLFLDGAVEALCMGVHFGRPGISPPVGDAVLIEALLEAAHELRAVIGEDEARRFWWVQ